MNVGIFTDTYYPQINGVVTSVRMLEKELNKLGHKVYIFTVSDPKTTDVHPRVFRLPSLPFAFLKSHRVAFIYPPRLIWSLRKLKLDIVHTHTEFPLGIFGKVVSEFFRLPSVHTYHTMYVDYVHYIANGHLITPKMAEQYSRIFCNSARMVIAPTEKARESLLKYGVSRPIETIPTGFDLSRFEPGRYTKAEIDEIRESLAIPKACPVIVTICRVAKEKSIDVIIKAMPELLQKLPDAKFVIVGDGPVKDNLILLAENLNVSHAVIFAGAKPWGEIGKYYQMGDCFVSASTSETQGLTYIEAMASGVPVVAKKDDSILGLVKDNETGFLFERHCECAEVLYRVLSDKENSLEIARKGFDSVRHMTAENYALKVEAVYKKCLENRPKKIIRMPKTFKKVASYIIDLGNGGNTMKLKLTIEGMSCDHCAAHVKNALEQVKGVSNIQVVLKNNMAFIEADDTVTHQQLVDIIDEAGYTLTGVMEK